MTGHPITPPPELVQQWSVSSPIQHSDESWAYELFIAHQAAQWGADQELEACVSFVYDNELCDPDFYNNLCNARRPKPPSLKGQALLQLDTLSADLAMHGRGCDLSQIRRALEQLND
jgi:hypothetical protein